MTTECDFPPLLEAIRDVLDKMGFDGNTPPKGWVDTERGVKHWRVVLDMDRNVRILYTKKAIFPQTRYIIQVETLDIRLDQQSAKQVRAVVYDTRGGNTSLYQTDKVDCYLPDFPEVEREVRKTAIGWLISHFPDHLNPLAYWESHE